MARFLVVGYGSIGKRHAGILRDLGHDVLSLDIDPDSGADYAKATDVKGELDGILLCTPPDVRWLTLLPAARCYFVEKPLGDFKPAADVPLAHYQVGFCYAFNPSLAKFVRLVRALDIYSLSIVGGQHLQGWHATDYRTRRWFGVDVDSLPHSLFIARWILGPLGLIGSVSSKMSDLEIDVDDITAVLLRSKTGAPCYLSVDYLRKPRQFWIEAVTSGGTFRWDFDPAEIDEMYMRQMLSFVDLCNGGEPLAYTSLPVGYEVQGVLDGIS